MVIFLIISTKTAILTYFVYFETQFTRKAFNYRKSVWNPKVQTLHLHLAYTLTSLKILRYFPLCLRDRNNPSRCFCNVFRPHNKSIIESNIKENLSLASKEFLTFSQKLMVLSLWNMKCISFLRIWNMVSSQKITLVGNSIWCILSDTQLNRIICKWAFLK